MAAIVVDVDVGVAEFGSELQSLQQASACGVENRDAGSVRAGFGKSFIRPRLNAD
jgi:hypothetical protein